MCGVDWKLWYTGPVSSIDQFSQSAESAVFINLSKQVFSAQSGAETVRLHHTGHRHPHPPLTQRNPGAALMGGAVITLFTVLQFGCSPRLQ